jgi:hypothetical protein
MSMGARPLLVPFGVGDLFVTTLQTLVKDRSITNSAATESMPGDL